MQHDEVIWQVRRACMQTPAAALHALSMACLPACSQYVPLPTPSLTPPSACICMPPQGVHLLALSLSG